MLSRETRAAICLHQTTGLASIRGSSASNANITAAFLQNDGEDDTLFNANLLSSVLDSNGNAANIIVGIASGEHVVGVGVKDLAESVPLALGWEVGGRTREELAT